MEYSPGQTATTTKDTDLLKSPLHTWHLQHDAKMIDFSGWSMPLCFTSIVEEHQATRGGVAVFDISHMGRLTFSGSNSGRFLEALVTRKVTNMMEGQIRYGFVTNHHGGILDDVLIYHRLLPNGPPYLLVVNAGNREKIFHWFDKLHGLDSPKTRNTDALEMTDITVDTAMIAVQGPQAINLVGSLVDEDLQRLQYYTGLTCSLNGTPVMVSRTGYTGEDGCELILEADQATVVWQALLKMGLSVGAVPAGLGCRDTLRLEAAMPLYGHELSEQVNPMQAGLDFAVDLEGHDFVGREALCLFQHQTHQPGRIGLQLLGKRIARQGCAIYSGGNPVGQVTSGTFSPTLQRPIALGYVHFDTVTPGTPWTVHVRGYQESAVAISLPFYRRTTS